MDIGRRNKVLTLFLFLCIPRCKRKKAATFQVCHLWNETARIRDAADLTASGEHDPIGRLCHQ